uniref:SFRICE_016022 n=1 Tax=Spodoptera frugiperda TaxID=7108 RepID=A0A2H1V653_SPOFR
MWRTEVSEEDESLIIMVQSKNGNLNLSFAMKRTNITSLVHTAGKRVDGSPDRKLSPSPMVTQNIRGDTSALPAFYGLGIQGLLGNWGLGRRIGYATVTISS